MCTASLAKILGSCSLPSQLNFWLPNPAAATPFMANEEPNLWASGSVQVPAGHTGPSLQHLPSHDNECEKAGSFKKRLWEIKSKQIANSTSKVTVWTRRKMKTTSLWPHLLVFTSDVFWLLFSSHSATGHNVGTRSKRMYFSPLLLLFPKWTLSAFNPSSFCTHYHRAIPPITLLKQMQECRRWEDSWVSFLFF